MRQPDRAVQVEAIAIRPAMGERRGHALQQGGIGRHPTAIIDSRNSAHGVIIPDTSRRHKGYWG